MGDCKIGGKNKVKFVVVSGRRTFCVTKLCKRMSANGRAAERQQNDRPPSKDYERKLTLIAENMRQLIDRQMTGHIKCTHTHRLTDWHSRNVVKQLRRLTVPTYFELWATRLAFDLIEFDVHVFNMTLSCGFALFRLYKEKENPKMENPKMECVHRSQSRLTVRNTVWS